MEGAIVWFNEKKGYGFIRPGGGLKDVFVHISGLNPRTKLKEKDAVSFDIGETKKGVCAINVKKIGG